ncbi:hypothetical protein GVAV_000282 [Gurleya vavrai]
MALFQKVNSPLSLQPEVFSLLSLLIHKTGNEITIDKFRSVFKALDLEFCETKAKLYILSSEKIEEYLKTVGSKPVIIEKKKEVVIEEKKEEEKPNNVELAFDDLFG